MDCLKGDVVAYITLWEPLVLYGSMNRNVNHKEYPEFQLD